MQHEKRDASQAMQGHPRLHESTFVRIQSSICCSRVNTSLLCIHLSASAALAERWRKPTGASGLGEVIDDATTNAVQGLVGFFAGTTDTGHRQDSRQDIITAGPLVIGAWNLRKSHLLGVVAHQLRSVWRQRRARSVGLWVACRLHVEGVGVCTVVAIQDWTVWIVLCIRARASEADLQTISASPMVLATTSTTDFPSSEGLVALQCRPWRRGVVRCRGDSRGFEIRITMDEINMSVEGEVQRRRRHWLFLP